MFSFIPMVATAALLLSADVSGVIHLLPPANQRVEVFPSENLPALPDMSPEMASANDRDEAAQEKSTGAKPDKSKDEPLLPESRLELVRFVDGELVRVVEPLPAGKNGFHLKAGVPLDEKALRMALGSSGAAINPGDKAQISSLQFKEREVVVDINGGGRGKKRMRDRIHMEVGGMPTMTTTGSETPVDTSAGATLFLDFDKPVPDMTPDELKHYLSGLLDFSKQHSAAVQWMNTLPPDIQNAIKDNRPAVGMDREMVLAAIGRPDRKVREKGPEGNETEDWIYGKPPAKTVFVKFEGDKVTQIEQYPQ
jgi:hypothetical protein